MATVGVMAECGTGALGRTREADGQTRLTNIPQLLPIHNQEPHHLRANTRPGAEVTTVTPAADSFRSFGGARNAAGVAGLKFPASYGGGARRR